MWTSNDSECLLRCPAPGWKWLCAFANQTDVLGILGCASRAVGNGKVLAAPQSRDLDLGGEAGRESKVEVLPHLTAGHGMRQRAAGHAVKTGHHSPTLARLGQGSRAGLQEDPSLGLQGWGCK